MMVMRAALNALQRRVAYDSPLAIGANFVAVRQFAICDASVNEFQIFKRTRHSLALLAARRRAPPVGRRVAQRRKTAWA